MIYGNANSPNLLLGLGRAASGAAGCLPNRDLCTMDAAYTASISLPCIAHRCTAEDQAASHGLAQPVNVSVLWIKQDS
jgi:hypothetical protein